MSKSEERTKNIILELNKKQADDFENDDLLTKLIEESRVDNNEMTEIHPVDTFISKVKEHLNCEELSDEDIEEIHNVFTKGESFIEAADAIKKLSNSQEIFSAKRLYINKDIEKQLEDFIFQSMKFDGAHDIDHIRRVVKNAIDLAKEESGDLDVIIPACWLHDCVNVPKTSKDRSLGSKFSADKAVEFLRGINYPEQFLDEIHHAIHAHSFSANIETKTLSAKIVQDADRLDALGALGIARCLMYSASVERPLYNSNDPFAENRELSDEDNAIDHFFTKLQTLPDTMKTNTGKDIALKRWDFMEDYIYELKNEITRKDL